GAWDRLECCLTLYPHEQEVTLLTQISLSHKTIALNFRSHAFQLNKLTEIAPYLPGLLLSGAANIEGDAAIQLEPFKIARFAMACELRDAQIQYNQVAIAGLHDTEKGESPICVEISGEDTQFRVRASNVSCVSPAHVLMPALQCDLRLTQSGIECAGYVEVASCDVDKGHTSLLQIPAAFRSTGRFSATYSKMGAWAFSFSNNPPSGTAVSTPTECKARLSGYDVALKTPTVTISGNGENVHGDVRHAIQFSDLVVTGNGTTIKMPSILIEGDTHLSGSPAGDVTAITDLEAKAPNAVLSVNGSELKLPDLALAVKGESGVSPENGMKSKFNFGISPLKIALPDMGYFVAAADGTSFEGTLELEGNLLYDSGAMQCSLNAGIRNAAMEMKSSGVAMEGIDISLSVPDLFSMRSAPGQKFLFKKVTFGKLALYDGVIEYQIDSPQSVFIESSEFKWCDGYVYTQSMRFSLDKSVYNVILLCDRLSLTGVMEQFDIAQAEGIGTVSGRLPLKYENGNIRFGNGFLFSAPGDGGIIHVKGIGAIENLGIPQNTPQYSQIDFTNAVLKDFNYNWVKITLSSKGEDMVLQMSIDGKPMDALPFVYNRNIGSFSRIEAAGKGGIQNPVHLDINFRLPLNKVMYYGKNINDIIQMLK
ncbi:MAG TPA: YdbH domain-containing protein, partial [Candidatus Brocadiaceae bacterium]|nr:YdbH domain-containing protein [Candidatus Brocadiaceae bacterium]